MLKISTHQTRDKVTLKLDGRLAGPWVDELERVWTQELLPQRSKQHFLDVHELIFANVEGVKLLKKIYMESQAVILAATPLSQALSDEIKGKVKDSGGKA
ncbi:MAG: hypothetical protein KGN79_08830 [Acidobacteriota bacterium]|nr:hypothetical protein [Acidobacteriota bacterium]